MCHDEAWRPLTYREHDDVQGFLGFVDAWPLQDGEDSDSEAEGVEPLRPLRNFPAVALITAIHSALEARALFHPAACV